jgi:hypothetical protein
LIPINIMYGQFLNSHLTEQKIWNNILNGSDPFYLLQPVGGFCILILHIKSMELKYIPPTGYVLFFQ